MFQFLYDNFLISKNCWIWNGGIISLAQAVVQSKEEFISLNNLSGNIYLDFTIDENWSKVIIMFQAFNLNNLLE